MTKSFELFEQHLNDLRRISPHANDVFVCPICLTVVHRTEVNATSVSIGHVWPGFLRKSSGSYTANHHIVLLCKSCNNLAGAQGDQEMQQHEKARRNLVPKNVYIFPVGEPPIKLSVFVSDRKKESPYSFTLKIPASREEQLFNKRWQDFRRLITGDKKINIAFRDVDTNWQLVQAGWLTSAYLYAFYKLGYRYILQSSLDHLRAYIIQSFSKKVDDRLVFGSDKTLSVFACKEHNYEEPHITYRKKIENSSIPHHLEVSFLDYHVRLPIPLAAPEDFPVAELPDSTMIVAYDITGHILLHGGECELETLLSRPDYEVIGDKIRKCNQS